MDVDNLETRLATDYESLRRREYELITGLLDVLPKIDNLPQERVAQVRDALFHADHPYLMVFVGPFSSGKSSIINALLGRPELLPVGVVPTTDHISILRWGEESQQVTTSAEVESVFYTLPLLKKVSFVDTPGLESVFQQHEALTRKFLHRSDVVLLVMLATQAMTARNLEYLQLLKDYGKKVIILVNQADLLSAEDAQTVQRYVYDEAHDHLGGEPEVWLVSAKKGLAAYKNGERDAALWAESGLDRIETYVETQLSDADRLRQKLRTPLQIAQNATQVALSAVRANQSALDHYQNISGNIEQQLDAQKREQAKIIHQTELQISEKFGAAAMSGSEAIRDVFRLSRAGVALWRGLIELVGLSGILRRSEGVYARNIFEQHRVYEPIRELPAVVDRLGPRLEGKDVQDIDDLVQYARREIQNLPPQIRDKVIGTVQPPMKYDRSALQDVRPVLEDIEASAREDETSTLDRIVRNTALYLVVYEMLLLIFAVFVGFALPPETQLVLLVLLLGLALLGLVILPIRGRFVEAAYTARMLALQKRYIEALRKAADKQVAYGLQLREDAIAPLTRLIEAQTRIQNELLNHLLKAEQEAVRIEAELAALGKKSLIPGLRG